MIQPILVRPANRPKEYVVVTGHRRLLAARQLGWRYVPARILEVSKVEALRIRLVENLHHEPLGEMEIAEALERSFLAHDAESLDDEGIVLGLDANQIRSLRPLLKTSPSERDLLTERRPKTRRRP